MKVVDSQQKSATVIIVFRAGTKHGPSFNLKDKSINEGNFSLSIYLMSFTIVLYMYSWNQYIKSLIASDLPVALLTCVCCHFEEQLLIAYWKYLVNALRHYFLIICVKNSFCHSFLNFVGIERFMRILSFNILAIF